MRLLPGLFAAALTAAVASAPAALAESLAIGLAAPLTGPHAAVGEQSLRGAERAIADINANGGILGRKLELVVVDDSCDPKEAVATANHLASRGVKLVVGHFCSGVAISASNVYADQGILLISPGATSPLLTTRNLPLVFRVCGRDDQQGVVAGDFIARTFSGKRVAVVHDKEVATRAQAEATRARLEQLGIKPVLTDVVTLGEKDFSSLVTKLKEAQVDLLFYGGHHVEAALILRQLRERKMPTLVMGGDKLMTPEFWATAGPAAEGALMVFSPDPRRNPEAAKVVAAFRANGWDPQGYTLHTYAAYQVLAAAAAKAASVQPPALAKAIRANRVKTVLGEIGFDANGEVNGETYTVYRWSNGAYDYAK
ncbi:MAG: branched-chain amino acid ABC transporter substrate-binding protein [Alphaproteobacteria bacterium]|nr:branched-chain amino acid ABC transporter substrate-binding protein [Alphaproteobacteria bacterium]